MTAVEHTKISLPFDVFQRGDIIAPVYFSVTCILFIVIF